jgi:hypothetical protein
MISIDSGEKIDPVGIGLGSLPFKLKGWASEGLQESNQVRLFLIG